MPQAAELWAIFGEFQNNHKPMFFFQTPATNCATFGLSHMEYATMEM